MDQRKQDRIVADRELTCRWRGTELPIFVYNLSAEGCMALLEQDEAGEGDALSISFPSDGYIDGRIVWRQGPVLGIGFARRLEASAIALLNAIRRPRI